MPASRLLEGRRALVTGAGTGIGRAIAAGARPLRAPASPSRDLDPGAAQTVAARIEGAMPRSAST